MSANPIPLVSRLGGETVYGYACPTCHQIAGGSRMLGTEGNKPPRSIVESSKMKATRCCACDTCGAVERDCGLECSRCSRWSNYCSTWRTIGHAVANGLTTREAYKQWLHGDDDDA